MTKIINITYRHKDHLPGTGPFARCVDLPDDAIDIRCSLEISVEPTENRIIQVEIPCSNGRIHTFVANRPMKVGERVAIIVGQNSPLAHQTPVIAEVYALGRGRFGGTVTYKATAVDA